MHIKIRIKTMMLDESICRKLQEQRAQEFVEANCIFITVVFSPINYFSF